MSDREIVEPRAEREQAHASRTVAITGWAVIGAGVALFGLGLALDMLADSQARSGGKPGGFGRWMPHFGAAVISTGWWILKAYPRWIRDTQRPGGLPPRNDLSRTQPPALLAMTLVTPALGVFVTLLGLGILVGWPAGSPSSTVQDRIVLALGGALTWIVSTYVFVAGTRAWPRDAEARGVADGETARSADQELARNARGTQEPPSENALALVAKRFAAMFALNGILAGLVLVLGLAGSIADMRARSIWIPIYLGVSMIAVCLYSWSLAQALHPRDKTGRELTLKTYTEKESYDSVRKRVLGSRVEPARKGRVAQ